MPALPTKFLKDNWSYGCCPNLLSAAPWGHTVLPSLHLCHLDWGGGLPGLTRAIYMFTKSQIRECVLTQGISTTPNVTRA